ncbi:hypothetical protein PG993_002504 [Apiospora rasikravindrae]|uniref:Uncharacterized protein n=1 Tax=Apiospora rasikravindrae TaxID=990691 RepID=A0ABR1TWU7_9PEZI
MARTGVITASGVSVCVGGGGGTPFPISFVVSGTKGLPPDGNVIATVSGSVPQLVQVATSAVKPYGIAVGVAKTGSDDMPT